MMDFFITNTVLFTSQDVHWWTGVMWNTYDYCNVFISCLDAHSDGTHLLQRIHWLASYVFSTKKVLFLKHSSRNSCFGRIENEENLYRLHVSGFSGTVEDSFGWYHDKQSFSTPDTGDICAEISHGGWWYHQCFFANLNGVYYKVLYKWSIN